MVSTYDSPAFVVFTSGCVPSRLIVAAIVAYWSRLPLKPAAVIAFAIASSLLLIYAFGLRRTGPETFGGPIWWDNYRPVHAVIYALVGTLLWTGNRSAAAALLCVDAGIGLAAGIIHHSAA